MRRRPIASVSSACGRAESAVAERRDEPETGIGALEGDNRLAASPHREMPIVEHELVAGSDGCRQSGERRRGRLREIDAAIRDGRLAAAECALAGEIQLVFVIEVENRSGKEGAQVRGEAGM